MLQRKTLPARPPRPLYQEVRELSDAQLSIMCHSHRIFPGPITFRNRRQAERQLHIALIEERARQRARHQFAEQCRLEHSEDPEFRPGPPPPQQHYNVMAIMDQPGGSPFPNYWPKPKSMNLRSNPRPTSSFRYRQEPVLEPRRYVTWQQQNRIYEHADRGRFQRPAQARAVQTEARSEATQVNFLGFKLPFSLETARGITTKIGDTLKRFKVVEDSQAATRFEGGSVKNAQEGFHDEQRNSEAVASHPKPHQAITSDDYRKDSSDEDYQADNSDEDDLGSPDEDFSLSSSDESDRDTLCGGKKRQQQQQDYAHPLPFDFREMQILSEAQARTELIENCSNASTATTYHDFLSQEPVQRSPGNFWSWWWPQRATAGNDRIPVAEQTREKEDLHEHEVKSIDYLRDSTLCLDDGVMEIMRRVDIRDDSEEEDLVVLPDGTLSTQPSPRTYARFFRSIFQVLLCDQEANLDPEKLRCAFLGCCMVFAIYMGYRVMR